VAFYACTGLYRHPQVFCKNTDALARKYFNITGYNDEMTMCEWRTHKSKRVVDVFFFLLQLSMQCDIIQVSLHRQQQSINTVSIRLLIMCFTTLEIMLVLLGNITSNPWVGTPDTAPMTRDTTPTTGTV
jgi:hypothetical protein